MTAMKPKKPQHASERRGLPRLLSMRELSQETSVPRSTWYGLAASGALPAVRIGKSVRVDEDIARAFIAARTEPSGQ